VAVSRKPAARPRDLSRAVEAAAAAAVRAKPPEPVAEPEPEPEQVASAAPAKRTPSPKPEPTVFSAPEADDEPEAPSSAPRTVLKGTVAKQATFVNAINLSKVNLIGVYGTQSKRYALIREANGRYKKVKVGDRVDGGRVEAITSNEVRYQKGGRIVTLAMPKG
jgi:Tfp pilus assembly protein PilP